MIKLFPHNEKAYKKLVESLKTKPLAFIEHATGTGKSFIMLKYLYDIMREKRILIVSMHYEMFEQLLGSQMETLGITRDDFKKLNTMIYHNIIKEDPKKLIEEYDCFVFDEAHHCGAKKWSKVIRELKELVKSRTDKKMIGFTATGTRYLDDYLDVSNEFFDGNTVSRLSVAEAILENLLPAPLYINSSCKCIDKIDYLFKLLKRAPRNEEVINIQNSLLELRKKIAGDSDVPSLVEKYNIKSGEKYIVFCSSIDDLEEKMKEAKNWFPYDIKMYAAHSRQSRDKNKQAIADFSSNKTDTSLMFAVDIFNEGFHVDDVDGVFMFRHTTSPIVYLQQIGRALSFSIRKKQIKIFDMVDNISDNDVILELYKEIIEESHRLIKEHPEKREFYEEILKRFKIVDNTNQVMDELNSVEEIIKNKYLIRNQVDQAILKLMEYRYVYPNGDVYQDLYIKKINKSYLDAYRTILNNRDYLTDEHISKLSKLNIPFHGICLDLNVRRKELGEFKNYKELEIHKEKEFIDNYVNFIKTNGFRPRKNTLDDQEYDLYKMYREFLSSSNKNRLLKLINANPDSSTVEELVLIGSIPSSEKIKNYLDSIRYNIKNNIDLDDVEVKVFNRIKKAIWIDDEILLKYIDNQNDINKKLDLKIKIIEDYLRMHQGEKFKDIKLFDFDKQLYNALKYIHRHWAHINNAQFKRLLELDITLPKHIDMTWKERIETLKDYDSFYLKEQAEKNGFTNQFVTFIKNNGHRPSINGGYDERELALSYQEKMYEMNANKLRELCIIMQAAGISLTLEEKLIIGVKISVDELTNLYHDILSRLKEDDVISNKDMKLLNRLINNVNFLYKEEAKVIVASQNFARVFYQSLYKIGTDEEKNFLGKIYSNYKHLSSKMVNELIKRGVDVPLDIKANVDSLSEYRTIFEQERILPIRGKLKYIEYVKKYKRRPTDEGMCKLYRDYLATLYHQRLEMILKEIESNVGKLTLEEEILRGNIPKDISLIVNHLKNANYLDMLDHRIYKVLFSHGLIENIYSTDVIPDYFNSSIERDMFKRVMDAITKNPLLEVMSYPEYNYLSKTEINKLNSFRIRSLARTYLYLIYDKVHTSKLTIENCLTEEELKVFKLLINCNDLDDAYRDIIVKITQMSYHNAFLEKSVNHNNLLNDYIDFIINNRGLRPRITSDDEEERKLAQDYEKIKDLLDFEDIRKIDNAISITISKEQEENFFDNFVQFVTANNRFPCNNAFDEDEIRLASTFMNVSKKLTKDQTKYINLLRKKFAVNTIKKTKEFDYMRKESNNEKKKN